MTKTEILNHLMQGMQIKITDRLEPELATLLDNMLSAGSIELRIMKPKPTQAAA